MSNEVKRYCCFDPFNGSEELFGEFEVVLASDYAALEAECERLRGIIGLAAEFDAAPDDAEWEPPHPIFNMAQEIETLAAELAAIRAAGGEQVEVAKWPSFEEWLARELEGSDIKPSNIQGDARLFATRAWFCGGVAYRKLADDTQRIVAAMAAELEKARKGFPAMVEYVEEIAQLRAELEAARKQEPQKDCEWCAGAGHDYYGEKCQRCLPPLAGQVSVPRELLERAEECLDSSERYSADRTCGNIARELRALLATPSMEVKS